MKSDKAIDLNEYYSVVKTSPNKYSFGRISVCARYLLVWGEGATGELAEIEGKKNLSLGVPLHMKLSKKGLSALFN